MTDLRKYETHDAEALSRIGLLTGLSSRDATGHYSDDRVLGDVYAVPYAVRDPEWAWVVDDGEGAKGYLVATPDTDAFEDWFWNSWWPERDAAYRESANPETLSLIDSLRNRRVDARKYSAEYPAHLHINLLSDLRGGGWGRHLIAALLDQLRADGIAGVHLVASDTNANAQQFYEHLGFHRLPSGGGAAYGMKLS